MKIFHTHPSMLLHARNSFLHTFVQAQVAAAHAAALNADAGNAKGYTMAVPSSTVKGVAAVTMARVTVASIADMPKVRACTQGGAAFHATQITPTMVMPSRRPRCTLVLGVTVQASQMTSSCGVFNGRGV